MEDANEAILAGETSALSCAVSALIACHPDKAFLRATLEACFAGARQAFQRFAVQPANDSDPTIIDAEFHAAMSASFEKNAASLMRDAKD